MWEDVSANAKHRQEAVQLLKFLKFLGYYNSYKGKIQRGKKGRLNNKKFNWSAERLGRYMTRKYLHDYIVWKTIKRVTKGEK